MMDKNILILLLVILVVVIYDFVKTKKSTTSEISIPKHKSSRRNKIIVFISILAILTTILFYKDFISILNFNSETIISEKSEIELLKDELIKLEFKEVGGDWIFGEQLNSLKTNEEFSNLLDPLFEKYYNNLDCIELLAHTYSGGNMNDNFAKIKVRHFSRALELGTRNLSIVAQSARYRNFLNDRIGARRDFEYGLKLIIENPEEFSDNTYANFYIYYAYFTQNLTHLETSLTYYEKVLKTEKYRKVDDLNSLVGRLDFYASFAFNMNCTRKYEEEICQRICRLYLRLSDLGSTNAFDKLKKLNCNTIL